jgi:hypothetical protein
MIERARLHGLRRGLLTKNSRVTAGNQIETGLIK